MNDWIDIGSSKGGSIRYCQNRWGSQGYGIDIKKHKCKISQDNGYDVRWMSAVDVPANEARWVCCMHVIEHLSGFAEAKTMIENMMRIATEGCYITFPCFDQDPYLYSRGMKMFYSDWIGHPFHCTSLQLTNILRDLGADYKIEYYGKITTTSHKSIIPIYAPVDSFEYDKSMGVKKIMDVPLMFSEIRCTLKL